jgi:PAS domain S-box-containing protein
MQSDSARSASPDESNISSKVLSALLIIALVVAADPDALLRASAQSPPWIFFIVLLALGLKFGVSARNAANALRFHGVKLPGISLGRALSYAFASNSILPTANAAFSRALDVTVADEDTRRRVTISIGVERIANRLILLALGGWGALELADRFAVARFYLWILAPSLIALAIVGCLVILRGATDRRNYRRALSYRADLRSVGWPTVLFGSLVSQLLSVAALFSLFFALNRTVTWSQCAVIAAVAGGVALVPIAYRSIGVMETAIVAVAFALGIGIAEGVLVATTYRFVSLLVSGGCTVFFEKEPAVAEEPAATPIPLTVKNAETVPRSSLLSAEILEFTHDAIIIWEMDGGGILYWNQAAEQLYGYSREQAYGKTTHALLKTQLSGGTRELETKVARYGVWVGELTHVTQSGRLVQVEGRLALMSQHNGRWLVLEVNRDITDYKQAKMAQEAAERQIASLYERAQD